MNPMKIMTLGYSEVGKTYFLGSLFKLSFDIGSNGFSIQSKVFNKVSDIETVFGIVSGTNKTGNVSTTVGICSSSMVLKKGLNSLFDIEVTDIEGQALEPGRNEDISKQIIDQIVDYDGLILVLEAPRNEIECENAKRQLGQMLNFSGQALSRNEKIPITLVINKFDRLPKARDIARQSDDEIAQIKADLVKKYPGNFAKVAREMKFREGTVVNRYAKDAISFEIFEVCETFFTFIRTTSLAVPCKVFLTTSFGFGCVGTEDVNINSFINESKLYKPYGSGAAFLWTIYARLKSQSIATFNPESVGMSLEDLTRGLQEDVNELHSRGKAYYDTENNDTGNIWSMRNIASLRAGVDG
jgi:GTPase SAR1 family protein